MKILPVVECAIFYHSKLLTIVRSPTKKTAPNTLAFPGGKVEPTDNATNTLEEATKREVLEELGIHLITPLHYICSHTFADESSPCILHTLFATILPSLPKAITADPQEVASFAWLTPEELLEHPKCPPWLHNYISRLLSWKKNHTD